MDAGIIYLKSIPGVLKIIESVLVLISFICASIHNSSWHWALLAFLKTITLISLFFCVTVILFRLVNCTRTFSSIHWNKLDCIFSLLLAILLIVSPLLFCDYIQPAALRSAIIFAYAGSAFFVLDTFYKIVYLLN